MPSPVPQHHNHHNNVVPHQHTWYSRHTTQCHSHFSSTDMTRALQYDGGMSKVAMIT